MKYPPSAFYYSKAIAIAGIWFGVGLSSFALASTPFGGCISLISLFAFGATAGVMMSMSHGSK